MVCGASLRRADLRVLNRKADPMKRCFCYLLTLVLGSLAVGGLVFALLRTDVLSMEDLKPGMELMGTVRNVIDFGAFIDIGVHQDGLVHISQISDRYIKHPSEVLKVGDIVKVWVLSVDVKKKRISLTMRTSGQDAPTARAT